jgi:hypothetical protein
LEVIAANLFGWDVRGNGEDWYVRPMRIVEPVDEMEVAGSTACGADGQLTSEGGLAGGGERRSLFVTDVLPRNRPVVVERVGEPVE